MDNSSPGFNGTEIAIIGMAGRFPGARNIEEFWRNLESGTESISFFSDEELLAAGVSPALLENPQFVRAGGVLEETDLFDAGFFGFTPREAEITDPQQRFFQECAWEALEHAGYDPESYPGAIGVYAGAGLSTYLINIYSNQQAIQSVGLYRALLGNDKDFLPTWVSYKLNLRGPSVNANTACSTSLVTTHLACQSLLNGECDMALAGGCTINAVQKGGYLYQAGGILSPDGHCRAFDARAQGTVGGSGVGIVVLRRLADALADGDTVYAVIRGSAINNDGSAKAGYTAPSVEGQAKVIAEALVVADVDPATISYVEAHGTGTELGDPIEIEALTQAYRPHTDAKGFCAIGTVKSNIGHLDTAAGVAGLIKTTLALVHQRIPPSLHFERPNPRIDFAGSPFYVATESRAWPADGAPRRAGVSSFGIGGTNAHLVLEEAPLQDSSASGREWQLTVLSARSAAALDRATANLAESFRRHPELHPADAAFTLQAGRKAFSHRRIVVSNGLADAAEALAALDPNRVLTAPHDGSHRPVAFLFPGSGAQYPGMGTELYRTERVYREAFDRCAELALPHLGFDLRSCLSATGEAAEQELRRTSRAMPALFATEYALAKLWMAWGIEPAALIGHSLGEYAAACLADVLDLEDAVAMVALRGRLFEELPPGAMLSVGLTEQAVAPYLGAEISVAAVNTPAHSVLSGPVEAIAALQERLAREGVEASRLHIDAALHSAMVEPILERFGQLVETLRLRAPKIPLVSCVTGTWLTAEEAVEPGYWVRHLRQTVRFAAGLAQLLREPGRVLLEVGPGRTLTTLANRQPGRADSHVVLPSMRHPQDRSPATAFLLGALGRLWLAGLQPDWPALHDGERRRRIALPSYPFERRRYWIEARRGAEPRALAAAPEILPADLEILEPEVSQTALSLHLRPVLQSAYVAPRNPVEKRVALIWQSLLGVEPVGVHDNLFELGGHSLLLLQLAAMMRDEFAVDIPMRALAESPTVSELALIVHEHKAEGRESVGSLLPILVHDLANRHEPFPLTEVQEAYWIGRSAGLELGGVGSHQYMEIESGELDLERFERAWQRLIDRHEMMRVLILPDGSQQILESPPPYKIEVIDLRGLEPEIVRGRLAAVRKRMADQVMPADRWPLFEIRASLLDGGRIRLHMGIDLLIVDNWSLQLLRRQLAFFYADPDAVLPPLEVSFRDHVLAETTFRDSPVYQRSLQYWMERVSTLPPGPELPLLMSPAELDKPRFVRRQASLDAETWSGLKARAAQAGLTPSGLLLAAYSQVLATWSKSSRFLVNLTLFNRLPLHPQITELVGDFTSLILLAVDFSTAETFEARARRLQNQLWEDLDHRHVSGVRVAREVIRARGGLIEAVAPVVFTSAVNAQAAREEQREGAQSGSVLSGNSGFASGQTPQVWLDHVVGEDEGILNFSWDVVEDLFPAGMVQEMFDAYVGLLNRLADEAAWQEIPQLLPAAARELREAVNATAAPVPAGLLHEPFAAQAAERPDHPAILTSGRSLSYGELFRLASRLGHRLRAAGAAPNRLVAVVMEKGWEQVAAVIGVLQSGAAYLPVDPKLPAERLAYLLRQGGATIALAQPWWDGRIAWPDGVERIVVGSDDVTGWPAEPPLAVQSSEDLAYVIFTSGSTGLPKGVMIDHRGALNTVVDVNRRFAVGPADRVLALSALNFDLSVYDIFGTLAAGATIVLPDAAGTREPGHWEELIADCGVTIWDSVPALLKMLVDHAAGRPEPLASLRLALLSGDWIPVHLPAQMRALNPAVDVISLGGATEASIWSILYPIGEVDPAWTSIPYGRPMDNQRFHVLDDALEPRPVWVPGQLYIGGIGVAQGYWRDEARTAASFFVHPRTGERLYRTGDLGRYLPDGAIEFLGREDFQVKIQGFRIELGEIETALLQHPAVSDAVVAALGAQRGEKRLVAYVVPAKSERTERAGASARFSLNPVPPDRLLDLLACLRRAADGGGPLHRYPSPSGDYPVAVFAAIKPGRIEELAGGAYRYEAGEHRLVLLPEAPEVIPENSAFGPAAFAVVLAAERRTGAARDLCLLEAGLMAQLLLSGAPASKLLLTPAGSLELEAPHALVAGHDVLFTLLGGDAAAEEMDAVETGGLADELRSHLQAKLPRYMTPAGFVFLSALPLSANGKVNRQALPAPDRAPERGREIAAPGTPLEAALAAIWREVLELDTIGVHDSFFEAGGHSLLAARLAARVRQQLRVHLSLASIFEAPTIAGMAAHVESLLAAGESGAYQGDLPTLEPRPESWFEPFPLTDLQQAYWVGRTGAFEMGNVSPQMYLELETQDLDVGRLEKALRRTVERHHMLRALILPNGWQQILREVPPYTVDVLDLRPLPPPAQGAALALLRRHTAEEPIALDQWPLLRVRVSRTGERRFSIHITISLLICDAWGNSVFAKELQRFYLDPAAAVEPLAVSFRDYVTALQGLEVTALYQQGLSYWRSRLQTLPPAPELPLAQNPAALIQPRFVRRTGTLDRAAWWRFKKRARQAGLTPDAALCTVYSEVLAAWSKQQSFLLNILYFNRLPLHPQVGSILGNFSTTILLAVDLTRGGSFTTRARGIQEQLWRDLEHSAVSGVRVLRELNRQQGTAARVTVPVVFASAVGLAIAQESLDEEPPPARDSEPSPFPPGHLQTPQVWLDHQVFEELGVLGFNWDAVEDLFPEGLIQEMFDAYLGLLQQLSAEVETAWQEEARNLLPAAQAESRRTVNDTAAPVSEALLQDLFAVRVTEDRDKPAVIAAGRTLSRGELDLRAAALGRRLRALGAQPERLVAVVMEKGWEQAVAVLGVLRSGAAYLPIDPALPPERFRALLQQGEATHAVTQPWLEGRLEWPAGLPVLTVDGGEPAEAEGAPLAALQSPEELAYVIFTSGSTGRPKGVMIEHRGAVNTILDINRRFNVGAVDRVLGLSALAFDLSVYDIFGALAAGGAVVLPESAELREPARWADWVRQAGVTVWSSVPALAQMLVDHLEARSERLPPSLRLVMLSGDWVPVTLPDRLRALGDVEVVSLGGATEASIWSIVYPVSEVDPAWTSIPYGRPMANQSFEVLNEALAPCPVWVTGQLYIGGLGLARGYWRDEERSAAAFLRHPRTGERLYRTGDLGRYLPGGDIEFLGREDQQVKVQGYRIELGEIESVLARHPSLHSAAVIAIGEKRGAKSLAAYFVPAAEREVTAEELRSFLAGKLPDYMVPQTLTALAELPLTANGKVDRGALAALSTARADDGAGAAPPRDELELELVQVWEQILGVRPIGITDNFFDRGGHSLLAVRLMAQIQQRFGRDLPLSTLFEAATVQHLAAVLRREAGPAQRPALVRIQPGGSRAPFFCVHPVGGSVLCYLPLSRQLGAEQPFYGLQVPGGNGTPPSGDIAEMAALYLQAMRQVQPRGPYRLGGWSMGGVVAFEMARQLRQAGEGVSVLALIDAAAPSDAASPKDLDEAALLASFAADLSDLTGRPLTVAAEDLRAMERDEALRSVLDRAVAAGALPPDLGLAGARNLFATYAANLSAMQRYRPESFDGDLALFRAGGAADPDLGWAPFVAGRLHSEELAGDHYEIMREPVVAALAERLQSCFEKGVDG